MTQFSDRSAPWMKLGKLVDGTVTAAEAAKLGGLDFTVSLREVGWLGDPPVSKFGQGFNMIPKRRAVVRDDTGEFFGFVSGSKYHSLQYRDAFNFMDQVNPKYVAAGCLRSGRQGFMVVETDIQPHVLAGDDPHKMYGVLRTSHDCSRAVELSVMMLRGKCMNQLTLRTFSKDAQYRWSIKHTSSMNDKLKEATDSLKRMIKYSQRYCHLVESLAAKHVGEGKAREFLKIVIPKPAGKTDRVEELHQARMTQIMDLWQNAPTVGYAGTGWGLVNAVSEHFDWHRAGGTPESRFIGALEGQTHKKINQMAGLLLTSK